MTEFDNFHENGLFYIFPSSNTNNVISITNNELNEGEFAILTKFNNSHYQSFFFYKDDDNKFLIFNINSLKILGVEETLDESFVIQKKVNFNDKYKWKIIKSNVEKEYYIELTKYKKRLDISNDYLIINKPNNSKQRFKFKKCLHQIPKSDIWNKWEKYELRDLLLENMICIIRSGENDNMVLSIEQINNVKLNNFTGNENQLFYIFKNENENNYMIVSFKAKKNIGSENNNNLIKLINNIEKYSIKKVEKDLNGINLYNLTSVNKNLNIEIKNKNLQFAKKNEFNQKFYLSVVSVNIFLKYIFYHKKYSKFDSAISFKFDYITKYSLDYFSKLKDISIDKDTKFIDDNVFKNFNIDSIKINIEWLNKFNKNNIKSISFNDNFTELNLNLLKSFPNLTQLNIPLSVKKIIGSHEINLPKLKKLICDPFLIEYFPGLNLKTYCIQDGIKELKLKNKMNPLINIKADILILEESLEIIPENFFDYLSFNKILCCLKHIKFLNKNMISAILLHDDIQIIPSNTFVNFTKLNILVLPNNLKKIESKAFVNCSKLSYIEIPNSVTDIKSDSFYNCNNLKNIKCKPELKEKLKKHIKLDENKIILEKKDMNNYNSITSMEIPFNTFIEKDAFKDLKDLKAVKCNPEILKNLPLNENGSNNIVYLIIQNNTLKLTKDMFKFCKNLIYISIPLSVNEIEPNTFDNCPNIRIVQCNPIFLDFFKNNYITSLLIQDGVNGIFYEDFFE